MLLSYTELREKTNKIQERLNACAKMLEGIKPEEIGKYENPQYHMWSGEIKDLEGFTERLEEWLNQPPVAEAKRYLLDLKKWAESEEKISLEEIEKDWRFLSDNIEEIKEIHKQIKDIGYESIKKKTSTWVLRRVIEKDISEKAKNWATNTNKFANGLKQIEDKKMESNLAEEVKKDIIRELFKIDSFDKNNKKIIENYHELIDRTENMIKNKPKGISEKAVIKTYDIKKKDMGIEENFSTVSKIIEEIKGHLINLEWVMEFTNFNDYNRVWREKRDAIKKNDLETISKALDDATQKANCWKNSKKKEMNNALSRIERMEKNVEKEELNKKFTSLRGQVEVIDWKKPNVESLHNIASQLDTLRKQFREELIKKLQNNEDAASIIEEPEIIEDLGQKKGWGFDRFFKALEVVLRSGVIEIRMVEEE
ncbi:MAG: hypothetical protein COY53_08060 [Elusimicrobia bacterium CG_4_10_14_0_8_um_filter_37_32]|nr:MAG: hypothetical protein COY53_08060 [Elusimicrobia bacterium CG_4_10_14_0_8_um_filter_37_32]